MADPNIAMSRTESPATQSFHTVCIVKDYVRSRRQSTREAFVPLYHPPGHAQVDFGEAVVEVGGRREKVAFFCLILPHSNLWFVKAYPRETTEAFLDGHVSAFAFLGGVPRSILYDNTTLAVARILGDGTRRRTQAFTHLQSHYLFRDRFGRPGKGNDKGKVEALVKTARRRFMVPIPKVHDLSVLNERLMARCLERLDALEAGDRATALLGDLDALRDLPAVPFEACEHVPGQISSTALVRYRLVDYSAPTVHAHKKVMVKGYVDRVEIALGAEIVARHRRSYVRGDVIYEPLHYLSLLEKKPGALDQAAALRGWKLLAACQKDLGVRFATASHLVHELIEARDEKRLLRLQDQLARVNLLIVDEFGYVPLSQTGSELLFDVFSRRYENGATIVTSNLPFQEWTTVFASERLTGALLDRITHHVHILEMNGESYRLKQSRSRHRQPSE